SLIAGMDCTADDEVARTHPEEYHHFCVRLFESFRAKEVDEFDLWLKNESQHGFLRLLPDAHKLRGAARQVARRMAQCFYRLQLGAAYLQIARAWGALMLVIARDFSIDEFLQPSQVEKQLFSQMHRPQFHWGALPLAFFSRPQLGWVIAPLLELWGQELL